tara:strand:- start:1357 stop:1467 length:111 start_codon:yes stop_codon:yes gene_type:complete
MIDAFCRWWLRDEIEDKKSLIAAYLGLIEEYRNQKN